MLMRYLYLAMLAATAATAFSQRTPQSADVDMARQLAGDFTWEIFPEDGFPKIGFDNSTEQNEVIFKYNFTGTLTDRKRLGVNLYQNDCVSAPDASLAFIDTTSGDELDIDVDVIEETISKSVHYQDINKTAGIIGFCVRVDYNYVNNDGFFESINFYETNVTINVDLTANFTLTGINVIRIEQLGNETTAIADIDYPVEAYICLDDNSEVENPAPLTQGSVLQVCVRLDETVVTENVIVEDILTFVVSQPDGTATDSESITNAVSDPRTDKVCRESGICNVKTQLQSKFFTDTNPGDLRVDGVAILAFGKASLMPSSAPSNGVRRLRAPIRGLLTGDDVTAFMEAQQQQQNNGKEAATVAFVADSSQRMLQGGAAQSEFGLEVALDGTRDDVNGKGTLIINGNSSQVDEGPDNPFIDEEGELDIGVVVVAVPTMAAGCWLFFCLCSRRRRREEQEEITRTEAITRRRSSTASSHSSLIGHLGYSDSAARGKQSSKPRTKTITTTQTSRGFRFSR